MNLNKIRLILENQDIIERVQDSTEWLNSYDLVKKADGNLRICLDSKDLNKATKLRNFKLPNINKISSKLKGAQKFTTLDATSRS